MGKIRTRFLGEEEVEKQQIKEQKERSQAKKNNSKSLDQGEGAIPDDINTVEKKKKQIKKNTLSKTSKHGKKYKETIAKFDLSKSYSLKDAVAMVKKMSYASFEETIEIHLNVLKDSMKGEVSFPHSTGKTLRVAVLDDAVLKKIDDGILDFDILVAHPSQMPKLAKYARVLGPKGLMPNPKMGTVSTDPEKAAENFKKGSVRWKSESKFPIIHQIIGKKSLSDNHLVENAEALIESVGAKNIKTAFIAGSMTPSVQILVS